MDFYPTTTAELIQAINDANSNSEPDVIHLVENMTYTLATAAVLT